MTPTVTPSTSTSTVTPNLAYQGLQPLPDSIEERANKLREHNQQYQTEFPDFELEDENTLDQLMNKLNDLSKKKEKNSTVNIKN